MSGVPNDDFDERLAEALDLALSQGEEVVAREAGDQGQAIALTKHSIILLRVGLAATGELDGHKTTKFALTDVTAVNFRKGALGAVIQVCAQGAHSGTPNGAPDNVVIFTGPGRVKKAEAFADTVEFATGKTVNRVAPLPLADQSAAVTLEEAPPEPPAAVEQPVPLAQETPAEAAQPRFVEPPAAPVGIEQEAASYRPNPRLPKPVRKREHKPNGMLVALGVLAALVVVGMAVMAPMREAQNAPAAVANGPDRSAAQRAIRLQLSAVSAYHKHVTEALAGANAEASAFSAALRSGNTSAIQSAGRSARIDDAWQRLSALTVPPGLAEANENLLGGLLEIKNATSAAAAAAGSSGSTDTAETLSRLDKAQAQISSGVAAIAAQQASLQQQAAELARRPKS